MSQTPSELHEAHRLVEEALNQAGVSPMAIFLFGSRARGQARPDSDWDFLVVVDRPLSGPERRRITGRVLVALALAGVPADVILLSQPRFLRYKDDVGHIAYYAVREDRIMSQQAIRPYKEQEEPPCFSNANPPWAYAPSAVRFTPKPAWPAICAST